jgi:hypothetical protein
MTCIPGIGNAQQMINGHKYVDLGLSVKWSEENLIISDGTGNSGLYAWGETKTKASQYSWDNYTYFSDKNGNHQPYTDRNGNGQTWDDGDPIESGELINIGKNISGTKYDVARAVWGGSWRMPTKEEFQELIDKCKWIWTKKGTQEGYEIYGPNGNKIFLPTFGTTKTNGYWSASLCEISDEGNAYFLSISPGIIIINYKERNSGECIRPVSN